MELQTEHFSGLNHFTRHGPGYVEVNDACFHDGSLLVFPETLERNWTTHDFDTLTLEDFVHLAERLRAAGADLLLLGVGARQRFLAPSLVAPLVAARIGFEIMTTPAACRTFNILIAEGRHAAAALLQDAPAP